MPQHLYHRHTRKVTNTASFTIYAFSYNSQLQWQCSLIPQKVFLYSQVIECIKIIGTSCLQVCTYISFTGCFWVLTSLIFGVYELLSCYKNKAVLMQDSPSLWKPSSCPQTTVASSLPKRVSQTVPQALLMQISTLPSLVPACMSSLPPSNLSSPSLQFPLGVEIAVKRI